MALCFGTRSSWLICAIIILCIFTPDIQAKGKSQAQKNYEKLEKAIKQEKTRAKSIYCPEIEDENLLFNCLHFNLSQSCFIQIFGDHGLELGEVIGSKRDKEFNNCWKREKDMYKTSQK